MYLFCYKLFEIINTENIKMVKKKIFWDILNLF